jgi:hypothetical protein
MADTNFFFLKGVERSVHRPVKKEKEKVPGRWETMVRVAYCFVVPLAYLNSRNIKV